MSAETVALKRVERSREERINWLRSIPFFLVHLIPPVAGIWVGISWTAVFLMLGRYLIGMFFVTAVYHRYFSHKSYRMHRATQFIMAWLAMTSAQLGVVWWATGHNWHHFYADMQEDRHTPQKGFLWAHVGWILCDANKKIPERFVKPWLPYSELFWLERWNMLPPISLALVMWAVWGWVDGLIWGFFGGTVLLWHISFSINSFAHVAWIGKRRFETNDSSRNSFLFALLTLGEGWHNNHHKAQWAVRQGIKWYEIDITYYGLCALRRIGLVWGFNPHSPKANKAA